MTRGGAGDLKKFTNISDLNVFINKVKQGNTPVHKSFVKEYYDNNDHDIIERTINLMSLITSAARMYGFKEPNEVNFSNILKRHLQTKKNVSLSSRSRSSRSRSSRSRSSRSRSSRTRSSRTRSSRTRSSQSRGNKTRSNRIKRSATMSPLSASSISTYSPGHSSVVQLSNPYLNSRLISNSNISSLTSDF